MQSLNDRLSKTLDNLKSKFDSVRTGRANPNLLSSVVVEYYGSTVPIMQMASVSASDGHTLLVNVYDSGAVSSVEKAIMASNLGLNPQTDGSLIRLRLPDLTQERRDELVKYIKKLAEEGKVALRNIRRDGIDAIKKDEAASDDDKKRDTEAVQKLLDSYVGKIDHLVESKETEIRTI